MESFDTKEKPLWLRIFECAEQMRDSVIHLSPCEEYETLLDLTISQQRVIRRVRQLTEKEPEGTSLKQLADSMHLTSGTTSALVETLVRKDLLVRTPSPRDRRAVCIRLSDYGLKKFREGHEFISRVTEEFFHTLTPAEHESLHRILMEFYDFMEKAEQKELGRKQS